MSAERIQREGKIVVPGGSPLLKQKGGSSTLSLLFNCKNLAVNKGFVKTSATWSIEGTKRISNVFCRTLSYTKCMSISICFVQAWYIRLASEAAP